MIFFRPLEYQEYYYSDDNDRQPVYIEDETAPGGLVYVMFDRTFDGCRELLRKHRQRKPERVIFFLNGNPVCEVSRSDVIGG